MLIPLTRKQNTKYWKNTQSNLTDLAKKKKLDPVIGRVTPK
jgi:ATP-dependent Clp protease ATP-binding subunit ClpA